MAPLPAAVAAAGVVAGVAEEEGVSPAPRASEGAAARAAVASAALVSPARGDVSGSAAMAGGSVKEGSYGREDELV